MPAKTGPTDAWSEFVLAVMRVNGLIVRAGEGIARPLGQSSARWQVLGRAYEPQTVAQMATDIGHARQSVQRVADALASEGLVAYRPHATDRRTKVVELTPQGLRVLTQIYDAQVAWSGQVVEKLDAVQLRTITAQLDAVGTALESDIALSPEAKQRVRPVLEDT